MSIFLRCVSPGDTTCSQLLLRRVPEPGVLESNDPLEAHPDDRGDIKSFCVPARLMMNLISLFAFRLLRKPRPVTTRGIIASLLGLLVRHATYIPRNAGGEAPGESNGRLGNKLGRTECGDGTWAHGDNTKTAGGGITSTLLTIIGETPAPGRGAQCAALRQSSMAALGELLFYVVTQEAPVPRITSVGGCHCADTTWYIPVEDVGVAINRCLEDTKFEGVQYHAAKTVENVMAQARPSHALVELLVTPSVTLRLFDISR